MPAIDRLSRNSQSQGEGSATCTCANLQDYFVHGAEEIELWIEHTFWATQKMNLRGSSVYKDQPAEDDEEDECFETFQPGEPMFLRMADWMDLAGASLDERLTGTVRKDSKTGAFPYRRSVGATLQVNFKYYGDAVDDVFHADVEVDIKDGWTSIGSAVEYTDYESHFKMDFYDRYRRGVAVVFVTMGQITQFDFMTMMNTIIQFLVLLGVVETIVGIVATVALPESPVYAKAKTEPFQFGKALADFSVRSALACQAFKAWDTSARKEGEEPSIDEKELKAIFKGHCDDALAQAFANAILTEARLTGSEDEGNNVTCEDLMHIMSNGLVSCEQMEKMKGCAPQRLSSSSSLKAGSASNGDLRKVGV